MTVINFIGCGAVGQTVGRLFRKKGVFEIGDIVNRTLASGAAAAAFIGAGRASADLDEMRPAEVWCVAASDDSFPGCAEALAASGVIGEGDVIFHLSGALSSEVLAPLRKAGGQVASVHPVKSFADSSVSAADFAGTWCGIEGDEAAVALLSEAFSAIGGRVFRVDPRFKTVYHAGAVLVCNYLTSLLEAGVKAYQKGGLDRETALQVMEPLVRGTVDNVFRGGTVQALTGPIARGDVSVVARQLEALDEWDAELALLYRVLGRVALDLSRRQGKAATADLERLERLLAQKS